MIKKIASICFVFLITYTGNSQNLQTLIKTEALKMARALAAFDLDTYASYTYPTLVADKKSKEKIKQRVDSVEKYRLQFGLKVKSVLIGNPSAVILYQGIMQCIIPQTITIEAFMGTIISESNLVGLSKDGTTWYFVDELLLKNAESKAKLPELSAKLMIPAMKKPVMIPNKAD